MVRRRNKFPYTLAIIVALLIGTASFAFYKTLNKAVEDILFIFGISNFYIQNLIIIGGVGLIILILGFGVKKYFEKLISK